MADVTYTVLTTSQWIQMQNQFGMYQISAILLFFAIIGLAVLFYPMRHFILSRFWYHTPVVAILDKRGTLRTTLGFTMVNGIWHYNNKPYPFVKHYGGTYFFAGIPFAVITIEPTMLENPSYKRATAKLVEMGYPNINALEEAVLFSQMRPDDLRVDEMMSRYGCLSYDELKNKINPSHIDIKDPLVAPFFTEVPLSELVGYGADIPSENIFGEVDDIYEANKPQAQSMKKIKEMLPWAVIIIAVAAAGVLLYKMFKA
jgi:hypothetical protein